jgi:recombinational DNA repair ATPase RecF
MVNESNEAGLSQAIHYRNYRRARDRARTRIAQEYPELYLEYLQEERVNDKTTGKTWVGIDRDNGSAITIESYKDTIEGSTDPDNDGANKGNNGGEA